MIESRSTQRSLPAVVTRKQYRPSEYAGVTIRVAAVIVSAVIAGVVARKQHLPSANGVAIVIATVGISAANRSPYIGIRRAGGEREQREDAGLKDGEEAEEAIELYETLMLGSSSQISSAHSSH
jgi:hypothetical protein